MSLFDPSDGLPGSDTGMVEQLIRHSPHAIALTVGPDHAVRCANASFCRLMSVSAREVLGRRFRDLHPQVAVDEPGDLLDRVYRNGIGEREQELSLDQNGSGRMVWSYTAWPLKTDDGVEGVVVQITDRTEQAQARRRLEEMAELIRDINQRLLTSAMREQEVAEKAKATSLAKTNYLAVVSQELRIPLTGILGYADVLEDEAVGALTPLQRESVRRIKCCSAALASLVEDVVIFGRMDTTDLALAMSRAMASRGEWIGAQGLPGEKSHLQLDLPGTTSTADGAEQQREPGAPPT